jgi:hypothetical protein
MYVVSDMTLIPQTMTMSCWYACARMLINWRQNRMQACEEGIIDPELEASCIKLRDANGGIQNKQIVQLAKRLGLEVVPPVSPSPSALESWMRYYGPLWVNGKTHITVLAGIWKDLVLVYDPSPVNVGNVSWRSLSSWYVGNAVDSRDASSDVEAVFLHCPPMN